MRHVKERNWNILTCMTAVGSKMWWVRRNINLKRPYTNLVNREIKNENGERNKRGGKKKSSCWLWLRRSDSRWEQNSWHLSRGDRTTPAGTADRDCMMIDTYIIFNHLFLLSLMHPWSAHPSWLQLIKKFCQDLAVGDVTWQFDRHLLMKKKQI